MNCSFTEARKTGSRCVGLRRRRFIRRELHPTPRRKKGFGPEEVAPAGSFIREEALQR